MYVIDFITDVIVFLWKNRNNPITMAVLLPFIAYLVDKFGRKLITNQIKRLFHVRDKSEFAQYKANQIIIMENQRLMMEHMGVKGWVADSKNGRIEQSVTNGQATKLLLQRAAFAPATIARYFTRSKVTYPYQQRRMNMKSKLLSRKLWMTILGSVILVLNQQFGWDLNVDSIIGIGALFMSFILGQSVVDTNGLGQFAPILEKLKSSKLWVSLIGSVVIILNDEFKWGLTAEQIYTLVGLAVTFILGKSTVSVVQASNKGADHYR